MDRRLVAAMLVVILCTQSTLQVLANGRGGGTAVNTSTVGKGNNPTVPNSTGVKVSVGPASVAIGDWLIPPLTVTSTPVDAGKQDKLVSDINKNQMWDPGNFGLSFTVVDHDNVYTMEDSVHGTVRRGKTLAAGSGVVDDPMGLNNDLAWRAYISPVNRYSEAPPMDPELYSLLRYDTDVAGKYDSTDAWLDAIRARHMSLNPGVDYLKQVRRLTTLDGSAAHNWQQFTWATISPTGEDIWNGSVTNHVEWSNLGILTGALYIAWAAEQAGDLATKQEIYTRIGAWAQSGFSASAGIVINLESLSGALVGGVPSFLNGPTSIAYGYSGFPTVSMYTKDSSGGDAENNVEFLKKYASRTNNQSPSAEATSVMRQFWGVMYKAGQTLPKGYSGTGSGAGRDYGKIVTPFRTAQPWGWAVNYPLFFDNWNMLGSGNPPNGKFEPPGKFTWELTPKGVSDITPAEQVNASSTITNLNISQNTYNCNNYNAWQQAVTGDNQATNKIRITMYHISEQINKGDKSTVYERAQVKASGKEVKTAVTNVTPGNGVIQGVPVLGNINSGEESRDLTDSEFLDILKTATGMSYSETVAGPLVVNGEPKGTRVTYAVYVEVKRGNTQWQPFDNSQAEYIEYRSEPGVYNYVSDDPEGYAEIKSGHFDADEYHESFEAMSGTPTTEDLYFVSGGQEFVAQIKYEYTENKDAVRNFEQKYSTEHSNAYFSSGVFYQSPESGLHQSEINGAIDWSAKVEGKNSKTCPDCGYVHFAGANPHEKAYPTSYTGSGPCGTGLSVPGPGLWELYDIKETAWNWESPDVDDITEEDDEGNEVVVASGGPGGSVQDSAEQPASLSYDAGTSTFSPTEATRWSFKVRANLQDGKDGRTSINGDPNATALTSSIKFQQAYRNMNYAKIKEAHVWRIEKSRMTGIDKVTHDGDDTITADVEDFADAVFNIAGADNAAEGRMYYTLHPVDADNFVFTQTLKTRGCSECYNHNAAEDLIFSSENPNGMFEKAWSISDYLILASSRQNASLLYHEYETLNRDIPIANISVSDNRQDNGYTILNETGEPVFKSYDVRGQSFRTRDISYNTQANALNGTREKICENHETYYGGDIDSDDLAWGGYNGRYDGTTTELASGTDETPSKYSGVYKKSNFSVGGKKIFKTGYTHHNQGEVNGFGTESPQKLRKPGQPMVLVHNDIDVHDTKTRNGKYNFYNSSIFYHNIITYGGSAQWSTSTDSTYQEPGFTRKTNYSDSKEGINEIVIHNPVSAQFAKLVPLPAKLDQRVDTDNLIDKLNTDNGKCPEVSSQCDHALLNCKYTGTRYHTDECYAEVPIPGLSQLPVTGSSTTVQVPITIKEPVKGYREFGYTGGLQTFTAPAKGKYKITLWGAQGGTSSNGGVPGLGGMVRADVYLNEGQVIYFYVGSQGQLHYGGYNGGGDAARDGGGGGGMTSLSVDPSAGPAWKLSNLDAWDYTKDWILIAPGGGGAGPANGGDGGGLEGKSGEKKYGKPGTGGTQTGPGSGGYRNGTDGHRGFGGSNTTTGKSGGGGGGAGWFGGAGGGNDYPNYTDVDDSGGGGGSAFINTALKNGPENYVTNATTQSGVQYGNGKLRIEYDLYKETTKYVETTTGTYEWDNTQGKVIPTTLMPQIFEAPTTGFYSVHLFGAAGGGSPKGQASAGGLGGYAGGQIYLTSGQKVLVTVGGVGSNASKAGDRSVGGYNGGGNALNVSGGGNGGGGATDIALKYEHQDYNEILSKSSSGVISNDIIDLTAANAFYWGPRVTSKTGHVYRVDYYGEGLSYATFDSLAYTDNWSSNTKDNATLVHSYVTDTHAQLFWRVNTPSLEKGQEFRVFGNGKAKLRDVFVVDMEDRMLVAAGGGGADNEGGTLNGSDDGRGGNGGGLTGENGYTNGVQHYGNKGAQATSGYGPGYGESVSSGDRGAGGAGWFGGYVGKDSNSGGGGGSSNVGKLQYGDTRSGQNTGAGYALFVYPGKGKPPVKHVLSCNEPHHAPNTNWHRYTEGWRHENGHICTGIGCVDCGNGEALISPGGFRFTQEALNTRAYIMQVNGKLYLTDGSDNWNDETNEQVKIDKYTLDNKNYLNAIWKATTYDAAAYDTSKSINPAHHYAFGDDTCYDPCLDDNNHKTKELLIPGANKPEKLAKFVVLDHDIDIEFPNKGDFYGNGALGLKNTQSKEGWGYIDQMDTTVWLKEKYVMLPFDVTYKGKTYLAGEKVMLGHYDTNNQLWIDDQPSTYKYTLHVLLSNSEMSAAKVDFVAVAKNSPYDDTIENRQENRNYTRYGSSIRAYHDTWKPYYLDVIGRVGVMSILDTGDFRFSNFYKQGIEGWRVNGIVKKVDLGKQNLVTSDNKTIFDDPVTEDTDGQNTWGLTPWMSDSSKIKPFPLTPGQNNIKALRNQAHRIGYPDFMSLVTMGNYYGENSEDEGDYFKTQIQPFYYYYNLKTKEWFPVDVYIKDKEAYRQINKYGSNKPTTDYEFLYNLDWEAEHERRMYTKEEENATKRVQEEFTQTVPGQDPDTDNFIQNNIKIPAGIKWLHGTANMLFLLDRNRTFIGTRNRYGENTEKDNRIGDLAFNRQAQRWHFLLGLPSSSVFVEKGTQATPENVAKFNMDDGVIVCALDVYARGKVWTLHYDETPIGARSFYLFDNNTTLVSWESAGDRGPQGKPVVVVYTNAKTSRDDLSTEGTH